MSDNEKLVSTGPDKGNTTVEMYRDNYDNEMKMLLNDTSTYETFQQDPTSKYHRLTNSLINKINESDWIDASQSKKLKKKQLLTTKSLWDP